MTVQYCTNNDAAAVDVALPYGMEIGQWLPAVVDLFDREAESRLTGHRWHLSRLCGSALDESSTLSDNGIRDGDLLVLSSLEPPPPARVVVDPSHTVAAAAQGGAPVTSVVSMTGCLLLSCSAAAALLWGADAAVGHLITAAVIFLTSAAAAVVLGRSTSESAPVVVLSVVAVLFAAVTGALTVSPGSVAAQMVLASTAALSAGTLLLRVHPYGTTVLVGSASAALLGAAASVAAVIWDLSPSAAGATLVVLALAVQSVAARIVIAVTRIGPPTPTVDPPPAAASGVAADTAHRTLTGIVAGSSLATTVGVAVVAHADASLASVALAVVTGSALLLRSRIHVDAKRIGVLSISGFLCVCAGVIVSVAAWPQQTCLAGALAALTGGGVLLLARSAAMSPALRRTVDVIECVAIATVVPIACWVGGMFRLVREAGLA